MVIKYIFEFINDEHIQKLIMWKIQILLHFRQTIDADYDQKSLINIELNLYFSNIYLDNGRGN